MERIERKNLTGLQPYAAQTQERALELVEEQMAANPTHPQTAVMRAIIERGVERADYSWWQRHTNVATPAIVRDLVALGR